MRDTGWKRGGSFHQKINLRVHEFPWLPSFYVSFCCGICVCLLPHRSDGDVSSVQDLKDHMRSAGEVTHADVLSGPDGRSKGFGLVEFQSTDQVCLDILLCVCVCVRVCMGVCLYLRAFALCF